MNRRPQRAEAEFAEGEEDERPARLSAQGQAVQMVGVLAGHWQEGH